jgi:hypothetical protein
MRVVHSWARIVVALGNITMADGRSWDKANEGKREVRKKVQERSRRSRGPPPFLRNAMTDVEDVGRGFTRGPRE